MSSVIHVDTENALVLKQRLAKKRNLVQREGITGGNGTGKVGERKEEWKKNPRCNTFGIMGVIGDASGALPPRAIYLDSSFHEQHFRR